MLWASAPNAAIIYLARCSSRARSGRRTRSCSRYAVGLRVSSLSQVMARSPGSGSSAARSALACTALVVCAV